MKPKINQDTKTTRKEILDNIRPSDMNIKINGIKENKNGTVIISCEGEEDATTLEAKIKEKLVTNYEIRKSLLRDPRIKIVGIIENYNEEDLEKEIKQHNSFLKDNIKILHIKRNNNRNNSTAYAEINPSSYEELMHYGRLRTEWQYCRVFEDFNVNRCYKCNGYNHVAKNCKNEIICSKCARTGHTDKECENEHDQRCINCIKENKNYKKSYETNHTAYDHNKCETYKKLIDRVKKITKYGK